MDDDMDCTLSLLAHHERPGCIDSATGLYHPDFHSFDSLEMLKNAKLMGRTTVP